MHTILHQCPQAKAGFLFEFRYHSSSFIDIVEKKSKIIKVFFFFFKCIAFLSDDSSAFYVLGSMLR